MTDSLFIRFDLLSETFVITCKWCGEQTLIFTHSIESLMLAYRFTARHKSGCSADGSFVFVCRWCGALTPMDALPIAARGTVDRANVQHKAGCTEKSP